MSENNEYKQIILRLATQLTEAADDADKFDRGQDAAGVRLRKLFLEISNYAISTNQTILSVINY